MITQYINDKTKEPWKPDRYKPASLRESASARDALHIQIYQNLLDSVLYIQCFYAKADITYLAMASIHWNDEIRVLTLTLRDIFSRHKKSILRTIMYDFSHLFPDTRKGYNNGANTRIFCNFHVLPFPLA